MADEPQISILDARLREIDRRLHSIQTGLTDDVGAEPQSGDGLAPRISVPEPGPGAEPEPGAEPKPPDEDPGLVIAELRGLISDHAPLLDAMGDLLASGERLLARAHASRPLGGGSPTPDLAAPADADSPSQISVVAGPFSSLQAVRDFERALETLPNVASVQARGYEGGDRAVVDVHFAPPNA